MSSTRCWRTWSGRWTLLSSPTAAEAHFQPSRRGVVGHHAGQRVAPEAPIGENSPEDGTRFRNSRAPVALPMRQDMRDGRSAPSPARTLRPLGQRADRLIRMPRHLRAAGPGRFGPAAALPGRPPNPSNGGLKRAVDHSRRARAAPPLTPRAPAPLSPTLACAPTARQEPWRSVALHDRRPGGHKLRHRTAPAIGLD
jgi:hypothetical protein